MELQTNANQTKRAVADYLATKMRGKFVIYEISIVRQAIKNTKKARLVCLNMCSTVIYDTP